MHRVLGRWRRVVLNFFQAYFITHNGREYVLDSEEAAQEFITGIKWFAHGGNAVEVKVRIGMAGSMGGTGKRVV